MIATSRFVALSSLFGAFALHLASLIAIDLNEETQMEAVAGASVAAFGNGFEDLVAGVQTAEEVEDTAEKPVVETAKTVATSDTVQPLKAVEVESPKTQPPEPIAIQSAAKPTPSAPSKPEQVATLAPTVTATAPPKPDTIKAEDQDAASGPVVLSKRPKLRTRAAAVAAPAPQAAPQPKRTVVQELAPKPPKRGNGAESVRQGAATGNESAKATSQGVKKGTGRQSGNALASNYPGLVMRKIQRVRRPAVGTRGTAVIAFKIASNGGLSAVSVASSSGSGKLDQAAMNMVRKAAPFPKPPAGAQRSFSIRIKGR
jgi:protein TonB